ncbi:polyketide cyclase [Mucilaginibacter conchicola]|uniref:Polyketide cyclase n=1 Tax=Mucilaginibacter conchicola TaxID=2303333 RepID=A0A372NZ15_9SPHI|nr:SRPBCC family protein [Mucilaginibacter conchicola]RFZ94767.1 polyketide cyclase [Mucilaginibacter conchicola]
MENNTKDRELYLERLLDAPVDLVWEVWTKPEHIAKWWGPNGFTTTIDKMDMQPDGEWILTMHGPDGTDYPNESTFKEVVPMKKIVYDHTSYPHIVATIEFEAQGDKTLIKWHMLFDSVEVFIDVAKKYGAKKGQKENVDKLAVYLRGIKAKSNI